LDNSVVSSSKSFRYKVLALLLYSDWIDIYGIIIQPEHFPVVDEQDIVRWLNDYVVEYGITPDDDDIEHGLNDNPILEDIQEVLPADIRYVADTALDFAKTQSMKIAIMQSVDDIKSGDLSNIRDKVEEALRVGIDTSDLGLDIVDDADQWMYDEVYGKRYPTGWPKIDSILGGGLVGGEYGLIMAPPGSGKTTALINIGNTMAGILCAANVLHVTLEMPQQKILKRYARRITHMSSIESSAADSAKMRRMLRKTLKAHLRVANPPKKVDAIRKLIDNLADTGFETGALIVDYADLIIPARRRRELRFELADISRALRAIAEEYDIPVWSATQAGRQAFNKEVITMADVSEAIEKVAIADIVIALCQTKDEVRIGQGRLFGAKVRDAESGFIVPVKINWEMQSIVQRGKFSVK